MKLTVKASYGGKSLTKVFDVRSGVRPTVETIDEPLMAELQASLELPTRTSTDLNLQAIESKIPVGVDVNWSSSNEDLVKPNGKVTRPNGTGAGAKLTVTLVGHPAEGAPIKKRGILCFRLW